MKTKSILFVFTGLLAVFLLAIILVDSDEAVSTVSSSPDWKKPVTHSPQPENGNPAGEQLVLSGDLSPALKTALLHRDPAQRLELLKQWATTVVPGAMDQTLAELEAIGDPELRFQVRGSLLSSWADRDLSGMAGWFGQRHAADSLHQQARDVLVQDLGRRDPVGTLSWMQQSLPESVRGELYAPFFRQWAGTDPAAASARLLQLSQAANGNPLPWNDLIAQVTAAWASTDLNHAVAWIQALPEGAARTKAMQQIGYQWAAADPNAAASYALQQKDPTLLNIVAGQWAEKNPIAAATFACNLPGNQARIQMAVAVVTMWAATDPLQATQWASTLSDETLRNKSLQAVAVVWRTENPEAAQKQIEQSSLPQDVKKQLLSGPL